MLTTETLKAALDGVNLSSLGNRCGLDRRTLQRIRDGENSPTLRTAEAIARALRDAAREAGEPDPFPGLALPPPDQPAPAQPGPESIAPAA